MRENNLLKKFRGTNFDDVLDAISKGLLVVNINSYIYAVPYVVDEKENSVFLKTLYPSRKLTKKHRTKL